MKNIIYLSTVRGSGGNAWYLMINLKTKLYNLSQNGSWEKYAPMKSKGELINVIDQLEQCGFTSATIKECSINSKNPI